MIKSEPSNGKICDQCQLARHIDAIHEKISIIDRHLGGIDKHLGGSLETGPGHAERIRKLEDFVLQIQDFHRKIIGVIIGSAGAIVSSVIVAMLVYILKIK